MKNFYFNIKCWLDIALFENFKAFKSMTKGKIVIFYALVNQILGYFTLTTCILSDCMKTSKVYILKW